MVRSKGPRRRTRLRGEASGRPFVGREREIGELVARLRPLRAGSGRLVLLTGEAGIGKTRLCEEFAARATRRRGRVAWGRAWEGGGAPPYWPWVQVLRSTMRGRGARPIAPPRRSRRPAGAEAAQVAQVAQLLPELAGPEIELGSGGVSEPPAERFTMFDAVAAYLRAVAEADEMILVLDDLHAADPASLLLLQFIAGELRDLPVLILGTYREPELRRQPLSHSIVSKLAREAVQLRLGGLSEAEVGLLIGELLHASPEQSLVSAIYRATAGNPFFVDGAVRMVHEGEGAPASPARAARIAVPGDVHELIRHRLRGLSTETGRVLSIASVIGLEFDQRWIAAIEPAIAAGLRDAIDESLAEGLLAKQGARHVFCHSLVRDTLYRDLPRRERVALHARVAECLEASTDFDAGERIAPLAHHWFEAVPLAGPEKAVEFHLLAAAQALSRLAYEETASHFERALEALLSAPTADAEARARILMTLDRARRIGSPPPPETAEVGPDAAAGGGSVFRREGDYWTIRFEGRLLRLRDVKGLHYIAQLLRYPHRDFSVGDLARLTALAAADDPSIRFSSDAGPLLDAKARSAYRARLAELRAEVAEAEQSNDIGRVARVRGEIDFLELEIRRAFGLGGRGRRAADVGERMRKAVTNRIRDAVSRIADADARLGAHLQHAIRLGASCRYDPREDAGWQW